MLSIENPSSDPSCSSRSSPVLNNIDERASTQLPFKEAADPVEQQQLAHSTTPSFSIRDYVFASRSKGIETNWPFPQNFLQLCLKHGISDPLPPFEPPDSVRSQCCGKPVESKAEQLSAQVCSLETKDVGSNGIERNLPNLPVSEVSLVIARSDQAQSPSPHQEGKITSDELLNYKQTDADAVIASTVTTHESSEGGSTQVSELEVATLPPLPSKPDILRESPEKKCRLVLKLSAISEARRAEDIPSTSSTVSDQMASKVCPVCKTFSSSSNTTLNAHIDQCLSTESNTRQIDVTSLWKLKVKPRKKRLMEDIYTTAPYCTLEDLDRRNGTSWATDLSLVAPPTEACTEPKRPKLSLVDTREDGDGAVYVDSNGIKLRILSKFNDAPAVISREEFKVNKNGEDAKEKKSLSMSKKKQFGMKHLKDMKVKPQSKKLSSFDLVKNKIQEQRQDNNRADIHQDKEESVLETFRTHEKVGSNGTATLGRWVCSKRSDLPKKNNKRDIRKSTANPRVAAMSPLLENNRLDSTSSLAVRSHILKFCRSTEDLAASPKAKRADYLQTISDEKERSQNPPVFNSGWSPEITTAGGLMLKASRSSGMTSVSSPRSNREKVHMSSLKKCGNSSHMRTRPYESGHPSLKAKRFVTLNKNVLGGRPSFLEASSGDVSQKIFKKFRKRRSILVTRGINMRSEATEASRTIRSHTLNFSKSTSSPTSEEDMDQISPRSNTEEFAQEVEDAQVKQNTSEKLPLEAEYNDTELATNSTENMDCDNATNKTLISRKLQPDSNSKGNPKSSGEQNLQSIFGSESHEEQVPQRSSDNHEMQRCDVIPNDIVSPNIQVANEGEFHGEGDSLVVHCVESQAETISAQESSACLTSHHGDLGLEIPQENSSITSMQLISDQKIALAFEGETSLSPVSTASTVSSRSPKASQAKVSQMEAPERPESIGRIQVMEMERKKEEVVRVSLSKEPEQPCCCSRREGFSREGLSREFQFLRKSIMAGTMLPSKGTPNLYIAPSTTPTGYYPTWRTESPTESVSTKVSSDCSGFSSPTPSPRVQNASSPNPVLRLMGKNLMVMNKEESAQPPKVQPVTTDNNSLPPPGFASYDSFLNQQRFLYNQLHQFPGSSSAFGQHPSIANHLIPNHTGFVMNTDRQPQQKKLNKKQETPPAPVHQYHKKPTVSSFRTPYMMKEVIVIDDSPEPEPEPRTGMPTILGTNAMLQQRSFSYFPQSQFLSREVPFPHACPKEYGNPVKQRGSTSEGLRPPLLSSPFLFQSPSTGHFSPSLYYS